MRTVERLRQRSVSGDERGSALVLALGFLVLTGTLVGALVGQSIPNLKTTTVVANRNSSTVAADAGVAYGIQTLRGNSALCSDIAAGPETLVAPPMVAGRRGVGLGPQPPGTVQVKCEIPPGLVDTSFGWAVITNDPGSSSITDAAGSDESITGPVFNAGGYALQKHLTVVDGDVFTRGTPCSLANPTVTPSPPFTQHCGSTKSIPVPQHRLPIVVPPPPHLPTVNGGCTTIYPGHYTTGNTPADFLSGNVYMASGVYYFDNLATLHPGVVFGGQPGPGETQYTANGAACRAGDPVGAAGEGIADGTGVEIIAGGNTAIDVANNNTFELYNRAPATADGSTPGISLYQVPPGTAGWTATTLPNTTNFLNAGNGADVGMSIHGAVYAPSGSIFVFATNSSTAALTGGADVWDITLKASSSADPGLQVSIAPTPTHRYIAVTSTATGVAGPAEKTITARAVVDIRNDPARTTKVDSWRTQQD